MGTPVFLDPNALDLSRQISPPSSKTLENWDQFVCYQGKLFRLIGTERAINGQKGLASVSRLWAKTIEQPVYMPAKTDLMPELYSSFFACRLQNNKAGKSAPLSQANHSNPLQTLKDDAANNEPGALYLLGNFSRGGEKTRYLLKIALAKQTYPYFYYEFGRQYEKDETLCAIGNEVFFNYQQAASKSHSHACYRLGLHCAKKNDDKSAFIFFKKAAELEHCWAQYELGNLYELGKGIKQSKRRAMEWYGKAADQGYARAMYCFSRLFQSAKASFSYEEKVRYCYPERSRQYLKQAAEAGHKEAQFQYGRLMGESQDSPNKPEWLEKAADQGHIVARCLFTIWHVRALSANTEPMLGKVRKWIPSMQKAAQQKDGAFNNYLSGLADSALSEIGVWESRHKNYHDSAVLRWMASVANGENAVEGSASRNEGSMEDIQEAFFDKNVDAKHAGKRSAPPAVLESESKDDSDLNSLAPKPTAHSSSAVVPF